METERGLREEREKEWERESGGDRDIEVGGRREIDRERV